MNKRLRRHEGLRTLLRNCVVVSIALGTLLVGANPGHANTETNTNTNTNTKAGLQPQDPTKPPGRHLLLEQQRHAVSDDREPRLVLNSILNSAERRLAVIDGQLLREGDVIAGLKLVQVTSDAVRLQHPRGKQRIVLRLPKAEIAKDYR